MTPALRCRAVGREDDTLGGLTPIEFEAKLAEPLTLAA